MKNRRSFLTSLVALVAAPVVPAVAASGKVQGRGMTQGIYHIDELAFFTPTTPSEAGVPVYTREYLDTLYPMTSSGVLSSKHLMPYQPVNYVNDAVAQAAGIQPGYYFNSQFDVGVWAKANGYEVVDEDIIYKVHKHPTRTIQDLQFSLYSKTAIQQGASVYPSNLYGSDGMKAMS